MNVYVFSENWELIDLIDTYSSIIWTTRYCTSGDFELYLPADKKAMDLLQSNRYLCRDKDIIKTEYSTRYRNVMIIEKVEVTTTAEKGMYLIVSGRSLKSILKRRIIWQQSNLAGTAEMGIRRLIMENAVSPQEEERKIPELVLSEPAGLTEEMTLQVTGDNLGDTIEKICTTYGYGYDIEYNDGKLMFFLFTGSDRSFGQTENPYVIFSSEFDNILESEYTEDFQNYKNVALVAGEGEGIERKTSVAIGENGRAGGLKRYEIYVDARDLSSNEGEYTEEEYKSMLANRGMETISGNAIVRSFSGEIETKMMYKINEDYFLGDIVQVENECGIQASPRVIEVIESEDESGYSVIPTFSTMEVGK